MPVLSVIEVAVAAVFGLAAARKQRSWVDLVLSIALLLALIALPLERGISWHWRPSLADGSWLLLVLYFAVELIGVPLFVARRVPLLRRRAEWRFDRDLHARLARFYALTASYPSDGDQEARARWGATALQELALLEARIHDLHAPTDAWRRLAEDYAAALEAQARYIEGRTSDPVSDRAALENRMTDLAARRLQLRAEYEDRPPSVHGD